MTLLLDTSSQYLTFALYENANLLIAKHEPMAMKLSDEGLSLISKWFKDINRDIKDIRDIILVVGPGSFTGVRIGVTIGKVLAYSLGINIKPISSLEAMSLEYDSNVLSLIDARRGYVYAGYYKDNKTVFEKYIKLDEVLSLIDKDTIFISNDNFDFSTTKYKPNFMKIYEKSKSIQPISSYEVEVNYLKLSEAEEKKGDTK